MHVHSVAVIFFVRVIANKTCPDLPPGVEYADVGNALRYGLNFVCLAVSASSAFLFAGSDSALVDDADPPRGVALLLFWIML